MHGLIFVSFRDYLAAVHGVATEKEILTGEPRFLVSEGYPDEVFSRLLGRACEATGLELDTLLHDFGVFTAERTFARLYPVLFDISSSAREFVLTVERPIHEIVRVAMPNALPPKLGVSELGEHGVSMVYSSPRRMCALLRGLVEGTARHYGETVQIEERTCMHRGDEACTFEMRFARPVRPMGSSASADQDVSVSPVV